MTLESAITFFIAIFVFGITPGPGTFAVLAKSLSQGVVRTLPLSMGMACGDIAYLVMACFGLATIAEQWETLFIAIRYIGAAYLLYLGVKMWTAPVTSLDESPNQSRKQGMAAAVQGFLISSSNPKVILFYIAFLPTFMDVTKLAGADVAKASVLAFVALMIALTTVSLGAAQARRYMTSVRAMQRLNRSAGGLMMGAGAYLIARG